MYRLRLEHAEKQRSIINFSYGRKGDNERQKENRIEVHILPEPDVEGKTFEYQEYCRIPHSSKLALNSMLLKIMIYSLRYSNDGIINNLSATPIAFPRTVTSC